MPPASRVQGWSAWWPSFRLPSLPRHSPGFLCTPVRRRPPHSGIWGPRDGLHHRPAHGTCLSPLPLLPLGAFALPPPPAPVPFFQLLTAPWPPVACCCVEVSPTCRPGPPAPCICGPACPSSCPGQGCCPQAWSCPASVLGMWPMVSQGRFSLNLWYLGIQAVLSTRGD